MMDSITFYSNRFPKLANKLKEKISKESTKNPLLAVKDHLKLFFEFYEENNAFTFFQNDEIVKDEIIFSIFMNKYSNEVVFRRHIAIEDCDEEFQINYQLSLNLLSVREIVYSFKIERDRFDDFSNRKLGSFYLSDFEEMILASDEMKSIANNIPENYDVVLNANF